MYHFFRLRQIMISSFVLDLSLKKEKDSFPPSEYNDWRSLMADAFFFSYFTVTSYFYIHLIILFGK